MVDEQDPDEKQDKASGQDEKQDDPKQKQERETREKREKARKRRSGLVAFLFFLLGILILLALVAWGVGWDQFLANRNNPETEDAYADGTERPLGVRVRGYVTQVLVTDNQPVRAGQLLYVLEDDDYRAADAQARARLAAAEARLDSLKGQLQAQDAMVARSGTVVGGAQAQANFTAQEAARQRVVVHSDLGLPRREQQAVAANRVAQADVARSRSDTRAAAAQRESVRAQAEEAQGARDLAAAQAERSGLDLAHTRVWAPVDGVLGVRRAHVGDLVSPGQELVSLTPLGDVWVTAYFNERQLDHVLIGDRVWLKFDAYPGVRLAARVQSVGAQTAQQFSAVPPENVTGNYTKVIQRVPVKIVIDPATNTLQGLLRPGMSVLARVDTTVPGATSARVRTER